MSIKDALSRIDPELLEQALEFAAHVMNNRKAIDVACKEQQRTKGEGLAFAQFISELGMQGSASMTTMDEFRTQADNICSIIK